MNTTPIRSIIRILCALPVALALLSALPAAMASTLEPFFGQLTGTALAYPASASDPNLFVDYVECSGTSNLGRILAYGLHVTHADTGALQNGVLLLRLQGGVIFGSYEGEFIPTDDPNAFLVIGTMTFTGGTGRYRGVSGNAAFNGALNILSISPQGVFAEAVQLTFAGAITTPRR
jgi:hypothetical protein